MSQSTINQRLKFLIEKLAVSARAFSEEIGEKPTNTQNYIGTRQIEPKREYLAKVLLHFSNVNPYWLLAGEGDPFLPESGEMLKSSVVKQKNKSGNNSVHQGTFNQGGDQGATAECEKERDALKQENGFLHQQLAMKDLLIEAKDETITLLRASYNRPN